MSHNFATTEKMKDNLDAIFHPKSIALVGVSPDPHNWAGQTIPEAILDFGYDGDVCFVSRRTNKMYGFKTYPSIREIPGPVDLVMCSVPAPFTPHIMEDCVVKGVKAVHFFTSGFSEIGTEEGCKLEEKITRIARSNGIRVIGPNCTGLYCPESKLSFSPLFPKERGSVGCLVQSGGHSIRLVRTGAARGLRFSKVVSYGNGCDLNATDFLEYLGSDPATKVIAAYVEGTKDGRRLAEVLKKTAEMKPVVLHKGGHTQAGTRAAASHTGAIAGEARTWDALFRQTGVIRVRTIDELVDVILPFAFMPPLKGKNVAVIGYGGGMSVQAADDCEGAGLSVPLLPTAIQDELRSFTPDANNSVRNPVDTQWLVWDPDKFVDTVRIVSTWDGVDSLILYLPLDMFHIKNEEEVLNRMAESVIGSRDICSKPIVIVFHQGISPEILVKSIAVQDRFCSLRLPVYPTLGRAATAISKFIGYHQDH